MSESGDDKDTEMVDEGLGKKKAKKWTFRDNWLVIVGAVLLSLATVATSWCAYQSARWSGVQTIQFAESNADRTKATTSYSIGAQTAAYDATITIELVKLYFDQDWEALEFISQHLARKEYLPAIEAWANTNPIENPDAPRTPLDMQEYNNEWLDTGDELMESSEKKTAQAKESNQKSDNYVLMTVMFASVLFFAGISSKFVAKWLQFFFLGFGGLLFITALTVMLTQPVH
ncbi:MAG: hypothetical protein KKB90_03765 [Actinobacteria bacterium]|nr:hypothetical protein [Actinomycetota bacterium]MCG2818430.1 hypothetical protein [Actinomycetes bacterium]MBU4178888.1 hypothetical protein [Actinomycetota bacterium]MBU4218062.1 hypothetical protein [Actinomycetota bacterium]MBU4358525.1 hypothetical protein [Actinomycetota bacterium]